MLQESDQQGHPAGAVVGGLVVAVDVQLALVLAVVGADDDEDIVVDALLAEQLEDAVVAFPAALDPPAMGFADEGAAVGTHCSCPSSPRWSSPLAQDLEGLVRPVVGVFVERQGLVAVLEHQRHIVRIYDLALTPDVPLAVALRPLQTFRPQVVMVVGEQLSLLEDAVELLDAQHSYVVPMQLRRGELAIGRACAEVLTWINRSPKMKKLSPGVPLHRTHLCRILTNCRFRLAISFH